jgi:hypothetical protein
MCWPSPLPGPRLPRGHSRRARSGKDSRIAAPIVCFEALFGGHDRRLAKGEQGVIPLVAQDREATRVVFSYVKSYLTGSPHLASMIDGDIEWTRGAPNTLVRGLRGRH